VYEHGGDDVGVVHLLAGATHFAQQDQQAIGNLEVLLECPEPGPERSALASASGCDRPRPFCAAGLVATDRYSRRICPLV
jgi:hypothetical protein